MPPRATDWHDGQISVRGVKRFFVSEADPSPVSHRLMRATLSHKGLCLTTPIYPKVERLPKKGKWYRMAEIWHLGDLFSNQRNAQLGIYSS